MGIDTQHCPFLDGCCEDCAEDEENFDSGDLCCEHQLEKMEQETRGN